MDSVEDKDVEGMLVTGLKFEAEEDGATVAVKLRRATRAVRDVCECRDVASRVVRRCMTVDIAAGEEGGYPHSESQWMHRR